MPTETNNYRVIGTRPVRPDGTDKVTGRAIYGADVTLPRLAYGKVLRSPYAHARIVSIDTSEAEKMPGVLAVITAADLPDVHAKALLGEGGEVSLHDMSANVLARGKVVYTGHAIAAVAALTYHQAVEAARRIHVEFEELPPVMDVLKAMEPDAPVILDYVRTEFGGEKADQPSNVAKRLLFEEGDIDAGFAAATHVVEREFRTATVHQGYIETHNAVAEWRADGQLTVWCSTQGAFPVRTQLMHILQHPVSKIKVVPAEIGGGFGGKINVYLEPIAAVLSKKTGRPIKVTMDRAEVLMGTGPTPGTFMRVKMGVDAEGKITAAQAWLAFEAGGFSGSPVGAGCMTVFAPYRVENVKIEGFDVIVNKPKSAAYRAPGATQAEFAAEVVVDELCEKLGMDPLEFRLRNGVKEGDWRAGGPPYQRIGNIEVLEAALASPHWNTPLEKQGPDGKLRGRGIASGYWFNVGMTSSCSGRLNPDGTVTLLEGSTDIGGTRASIAMQFAEEFGCAYEEVNPSVVDTESVGFTEVTGGSRTTYATGLAAYELAKAMKAKLIDAAAKLWEVDPASITAENGTYRYNGSSATTKELAAKVQDAGEQIQAAITVSPTGHGGAFSTQIADVEVDPETGKVDVVRFTVVQDAGKAIHPSYVEGQMQGAVAQGIGWALWEEYFYNDQGQLRNASLLDYRMPTTLDVPPIETIIVEVPNPGHPYGVRGVGEVPIVPPPAAIANAIHDAIGVRLRDLPMAPHKVCAAIQEAAG
jgi:xanthine dehydrogenase molybdenum-binding subunit